MTQIRWNTLPESKRVGQLREVSNKNSTGRNPMLRDVARLACEDCPFRPHCELQTKNNRPYGLLALILTRGTDVFPDPVKNRRNFRHNLDRPDADGYTCAQLLKPLPKEEAKALFDFPIFCGKQ